MGRKQRSSTPSTMPLTLHIPKSELVAIEVPHPAAPRQRSLSRIVYGYLPYWVSDLSNMRFEDLSHLADFAIEMSADGSLMVFVLEYPQVYSRIYVELTAVSGTGTAISCAAAFTND